MALILTIGSNTFVTLTEANNYLEGKIGADNWATLTDTQKKQCLISAYRWLVRLGVPSTSTSTIIKNTQIELAWWLYNNYEEYEDRESLYASGVRSFRLGEWSESLSEVDMPKFVKDAIGDIIGIGGYFPEFNRDLE